MLGLDWVNRMVGMNGMFEGMGYEILLKDQIPTCQRHGSFICQTLSTAQFNTRTNLLNIRILSHQMTFLNVKSSAIDNIEA